MNSNYNLNEINDNKKFNISYYDNYNRYHHLIDAYIDTFTSSIEYYSRLNSAFIDALSVPFKDAREEIKEIKKEYLQSREIVIDNNHQQELYKKAEKIILSKMRNKFDANFREKSFTTSLSEFIDSYSNLANVTGFGLLYQYASNMNSYWNNVFIEPIRDRMYRTPSHKIYSENKYVLFHYLLPHKNYDKTENVKGANKKTMTIDQKLSSDECDMPISTPLLIIYAFINRNYILDLLPNSSVVRNLQRQGFDIYITDWGTPSAYDKNLTLGHYVNNYLANAVDYIREHSNSDKISLLGYCWGGDLALMLAALYPEKIKNIVTFATPGDFSIDDNLLSIWTRNINADTLVDTFGNAPSAFINSAFLLRSPIDYLHKYPHFFLEGKFPDVESIMEFIATETWLYDSPPIIGEIYRQFVKDCYKKNLLIKNEMMIAKDSKIDLGNIQHPFLNVIATRDDLVAPLSSRAINNAIASLDNSIIEFNSGHVGACSRAQKELWPIVGNWLKSR